MLAQSIVALVPRRWMSGAALDPSRVPLASKAVGLCEEERLAAQPAAAFCSGVLVDWDLVLTAGHCLRVHDRRDFVVLFGYAMVAPGQLNPQMQSRNVVAILHEALGHDDGVLRDHAWLKLDRPVGPPLRPAPVVKQIDRIAVGNAALVASTPWGVPTKLDAGGAVRGLNPELAGSFSVDADTSGGSSGGGAFDTGLALMGVLSSGFWDTVITSEGCHLEIHEPDGARGSEQFTYAAAALEALCRSDPGASSLCRDDCPEPCEALPPVADLGGCTVGRTNRNPGAALGLAIVLLAVISLARRNGRKC